MPERFDLTYIGTDGNKHRPVMIHRVVFGSIERFIAILTEHYAGDFPVWLAPIQVKILTIIEKHREYALNLLKTLQKNDIRAEIDLRNEKIGFKIREARLEKVPYMLIIGDKEVEKNLVAVRSRESGDLGQMDVSSFLEKVVDENAKKL
jgi:threonyl-tRNA synthetase